ncbi:hypothetical protein DFH06DRAFT_1209625 [Mycena polygramma]|nr:hypothetical protein DFH06DRAFT_1209625 [Mycena polygramma]
MAYCSSDLPMDPMMEDRGTRNTCDIWTRSRHDFRHLRVYTTIPSMSSPCLHPPLSPFLPSIPSTTTLPPSPPVAAHPTPPFSLLPSPFPPSPFAPSFVPSSLRSLLRSPSAPFYLSPPFCPFLLFRPFHVLILPCIAERIGCGGARLRSKGRLHARVGCAWSSPFSPSPTPISVLCSLRQARAMG